MNNYVQLGALDILTQKYMSPALATKGRDYECIDCKKKVILRKGNVRIPHFAHYSQTNTCHYYTHPNESQIHKDAKLLMAQLLKDKKEMLFTWKCAHCHSTEWYQYWDSNLQYKEGDEVVVEYRSKDGTYVADVAIVNNEEVRYIFEIKNTHATQTKRPEPWFEVEAKVFIEEVNKNIEDMRRENEKERTANPKHIDYQFPFFIPCIRSINRYCNGSFCSEEKWVCRIPSYDETLTDNSCILCHKFSPYAYYTTYPYSKQYITRDIRLCKECMWLDAFHHTLRNMYSNDNTQTSSAANVSENEVLARVPSLINRVGASSYWKQSTPCVSCERVQYSPVYQDRQYYAICKICLDNPQTRKDTLKQLTEKRITSEQKCLITFPTT